MSAIEDRKRKKPQEKESQANSLKRHKSEPVSPPSGNTKSEIDPSKNPYLAHLYPAEEEEDWGPLAGFKRHNTTAKMANIAEEGPSNPFNGNKFSDRYFKILEGRRALPIPAQR